MHRTSHVAAVSTEGQGRLRRALSGAAFVPRGIRLFLRSPDLWLLGLVPVAVSAVIVLGLLAVLGFRIDEIVAWITPWADGWAAGMRQFVRVLAGLLVLVAYLVAVVLSFAAITNIIGQPFYEIMSDKVEARLGNAPPGPGTPWWRTLPRATLESLVLIVLAVVIGLPLFAAGFIPVIGQVAIPVIGVVVSGLFIAIELMAIPLERRGLRLRGRLAFVSAHRPEAIGFGVVAFLLFLIPLMNVLAMPGAIVGGTLLVRRLTGLDLDHALRAGQGSAPDLRPS